MSEPVSPYVGRLHLVYGGTHHGGSLGAGEREVAVEVERVELIADGVASVSLRSAAGGLLPEWTAGAHVDLVLPDGRSTQFSLCGDPEDRDRYRVGVLLGDPEGVSAGVQQLREGDRVLIRGPRNHFALEPAGSYVFLAAGIGITPLLPMIDRARSAGVPWELVYLGRSRASMAFLEEVLQAGDTVTVWARDEQTVRFDVPALVRGLSPDAALYCCGPERLLSAVEEAAASPPGARVRLERFTPVELDREDDTPIEVRCELSDLTVEVPPGTSILAACRDAGIATVSSCNKGICGTCETVVLEGTPDHRDSVLDEDEKEQGDTMMICVSRALGPRLVLDL